MSEVVLRGVCKNYGKVEAVKDVNLNCEDGKLTCLLGPSGCGKSSTVRMIAGLEEITKGEIFIGKKLVNNVPSKNRHIAMVFETYALYPHLSVYNNIAFPLRIRNFSKSQIDKKVKEVAERLEMDDFLFSGVSGLGDGQKQRVSLARALVREPDVFLMDEPISHLDAKLRARLRSDLKRLQRETETTCIYITHDQIEAMSLGDKIVIMNNGVIQQIGTPEEVFDHPTNEFVAGFVGEPPMNILNCKVVTEGDNLFLASTSFKINILGRAKDIIMNQKIPSMVRAGIRPTDIKLSVKEPEAHGVESTIYTTEPRGDSMVLTLKTGENLIKVESMEELELEHNDKIWWYPEKEKIHIFDSVNGQSFI